MESKVVGVQGFPSGSPFEAKIEYLEALTTNNFSTIQKLIGLYPELKDLNSL